LKSPKPRWNAGLTGPHANTASRRSHTASNSRASVPSAGTPHCHNNPRTNGSAGGSGVVVPAPGAARTGLGFRRYNRGVRQVAADVAAPGVDALAYGRRVRCSRRSGSAAENCQDSARAEATSMTESSPKPSGAEESATPPAQSAATAPQLCIGGGKRKN
jgi:hypothetical protein